MPLPDDAQPNISDWQPKNTSADSFFVRTAKNVIRRLPGYRALDRYLLRRYTGWEQRETFRRGHYHSPLPDIMDVEDRAEAIFDRRSDVGLGIDLHTEDQRELLERLKRWHDETPWPDEPDSRFRFYFNQGTFPRGDAIVLFGLLCELRPKRVIEIGSGFSSALMLDVNDHYLDRTVDFTFVDPDLRRLRALLEGYNTDHRVELIERPVQDVPIATFQTLGPGDILFVDSSHVAKIGSDVNYLFFEVLPMLSPGVVVHFHDVFWPFEYPLQWIRNTWAWNEAYMLRAFLQYNDRFEIMLFNNYVTKTFKDFIDAHMPRVMDELSSSIWLRKSGSRDMA